MSPQIQDWNEAAVREALAPLFDAITRSSLAYVRYCERATDQRPIPASVFLDGTLVEQHTRTADRLEAVYDRNFGPTKAA